MRTLLSPSALVRACISTHVGETSSLPMYRNLSRVNTGGDAKPLCIVCKPSRTTRRASSPWMPRRIDVLQPSTNAETLRGACAMPPALSRPTPALRVARASYWRVPAHGLPGAARSTRAALWSPPAAALCRAAFAGGRVPFPVFERLLVIFSPSAASLPMVHAVRVRLPVRYVGSGASASARGRILSSPRPSSSFPSSPALESAGSGRALVDGALRAALGMRGPLRWRPLATRRRIGAEVPARLRARGPPRPVGAAPWAAGHAAAPARPARALR